MLSLIAAVASNRAIGNENKLLYWLPDDLKRFKALTSGHTILMGRKTFESFPKGALPNRRNVVLSHKPLSLAGAEVFSSLQDALDACSEDEDVFVIGGETLYRQCIDMADRMFLTYVDDTPSKADAFFPKFTEGEWKIVGEERHAVDERHKYPFRFIDYQRVMQH